MGTYYVATTGSDTTGDGSAGAPWATVMKAIASVSTAGGHTILVADGTYQQANASGYWYVNGVNFADWVTVQPVNGALGDVTLQAVSSADWELRFNAASKLRFKWCKFPARANTVQGVISFRQGTMSDIELIGCTITPMGHSTTRNGVLLEMGSGVTGLSGILLDGCTITQSGTGTANGVRGGNSASVPCGSVTIRGCTINVSGCGVYWVASDAGKVSALLVDSSTITGGALGALRIQGGDNMVVQDSRVLATGYGLLIGSDTESGGKVVSTSGIYRCTVISTVSHGMLIGSASSGYKVYGCTVLGQDEGIVCKGSSSADVQDCYASSVTGTVLYSKGSSEASFKRCTGVSTGAGFVIGCTIATTVKSSAMVVQDCRLYAHGAAQIFNWSGADGDSGGGVCNRNVYTLRAAGWGVVQGGAVADLAAVQAAWAGYGAGTNDANSRRGKRRVLLL